MLLLQVAENGRQHGGKNPCRPLPFMYLPEAAERNKVEIPPATNPMASPVVEVVLLNCRRPLTTPSPVPAAITGKFVLPIARSRLYSDSLAERVRDIAGPYEPVRTLS